MLIEGIWDRWRNLVSPATKYRGYEAEVELPNARDKYKMEQSSPKATEVKVNSKI